MLADCLGTKGFGFLFASKGLRSNGLTVVFKGFQLGLLLGNVLFEY